MTETGQPRPTDPEDEPTGLFSFRLLDVDGVNPADFEPLQRQIKALYVFLIALFVPLMAGLVVVQIVAPASVQDDYRLLVVFCTFLNILAILFLRYGFVKAAAQTLVAMTMVLPWGALLIDPSILAGDMVPLMYTSFPILLSAIFLFVWETVVASAAQILLLIYILFSTGLAQRGNAYGLLGFVLMLSVFSAAFSLIRERNWRQLLFQNRLLEKSRSSLHRQSILDPLTGLYNRRHLDKLMQEELTLAAERGKPLGFLMLDIDQFKQINDTYGHDIGDRVLREVGQLLSSSIRQTDYLVRYGGDELVLVMPGTTTEVAQRRADQFRETIEGLVIPVDGQIIDDVTLSIGVATYPDHGVTQDSLVRAADQAMHGAKNLGRNLVMVAKPASRA